MLGIVWGLISKVSMKVWIGIAIVIAVLLLLARVKNAGRLIERAEAQARALEIKDEQARAALRAPRTRRALADDMRRGRF